MAKKLISIFLVLVVCSSFSLCFAEGMTPYADSLFSSAYISLSSIKDATFVADVYYRQSAIKVTAASLQKKDSDGSFYHFCNLPAPSDVCENTFSYTSMKDYASFIGTGTYRIKATFNADGYEITRYSNERTY